MKNAPAIPLAVTVLLGMTSAWAQEESAAPVVYPVETYTCKYNDGQGPADLDKAIASWNEYMDEQDDHTYFAMTITPNYFGGETFQVGWLGSTATAEAMGAGHDNWRIDGGENAAAFARVLTCDSHSNFATMQVKAPAENEATDNLVLTFTDCKVREGKGMDEVFTAIDAWTAYTVEQGYHNSAWVMFPAYGVDDADYNFKMVNAYNSHTDMGKDYDLYANGGGYQKHGELLSELLSCDVSRVYDGVVHRRPASEEE